ncbi:COG3772 Phage-related lysozyme (muraminidase) [uncultured Caudovirales phage]|uniref:Endolysin n=1 Tax=uncultured Caudovirales phage TaxID=2100421 RepID=A0A6J5QDZ7_9CAUD|nr:COG3772 Phage-related lysozyme (muraminidase) [uncultured Caudovirales phage]CAB4197410.1 COG3772 Phage-related lysozyme (muraminidase) [uncultured Caudovirales phage]CAB5227368.1 COG3772 Phage-related lysozyme (muraminidase) [uncultured Caudovirales phage]
MLCLVSILQTAPLPNAVSNLTELYRLIKLFEGCRLIPYICPAGVWTCGWGTTGVGVIPGQAWSQEYADKRMEMDAVKFARSTVALCPSLATDSNKLSSIADFAYNCGEGALAASTLRRKINEGNLKEVPAQLRRWVNGGGKVLPGLVRRREAEILVFLRTS